MLILCGLSDVRTHLTGEIAAGSTEWDAVISDIIRGVSQHFEHELGGRPLDKLARTETFDVRPGALSVRLCAYPVDLSAAFEVRADYTRAFGSGTIRAASTYNVQAATGVVRFDRGALPVGLGVLRITYTAGLAVNTSELPTVAPALKRAAVLQVIHEFRRRNTLDTTQQSIAGFSGGWDGQIDVLKHVRSLLQPFVRQGGVW